MTAGTLQIVVIHGDTDQPSRTVFTLFTDGGQRFNLKVEGGSQWRTHMRLNVTGRVVTDAAQGGGLMPDLLVDSAVEIAPPPTPAGMRTTGGGLSGSAPAVMRVLFVLVTMCGMTPVLTPEVSHDCDWHDRGSRRPRPPAPNVRHTSSEGAWPDCRCESCMSDVRTGGCWMLHFQPHECMTGCRGCHGASALTLVGVSKCRGGSALLWGRRSEGLAPPKAMGTCNLTTWWPDCPACPTYQYPVALSLGPGMCRRT
jgi:hypothetical protein